MFLWRIATARSMDIRRCKIMGKLLKYELKKTWALKLIILGITAVAELAFLITLFLDSENRSVLGVTCMLLFFIALGGTILIGVQSVLTLHRDMNTKQGYMLYMTPRNSFQILGAKLLENGLSLALAGGFFFLLGLLDVSLLFSRLGSLEDLWKLFQDFVQMINDEIRLSTESILCLVTELLASWLATVSIAYLADIVSSALLNGKKMNGLLSFLFFILLTVLLNWIQNQFHTGMAIEALLLIRAGIALLYSVLMYVISALVMDRYLSV